VGFVDGERDAIRGEILRLADRDLDRYDFAREAARVLRRAVPFDAMAGVWFDPETGLPVDEWIDNSLAGGAGSRLPEIGLQETDITAFRQLAASGRTAASMSEATGGTLDRSRGSGDELRSVYLGDSGMWCGYVMHRERGAPDFAGQEVDLIASLNGGRSDLQRVRLQQDLSSDVGDGDPGLLLLDDQDGVEMANPAAAAWLDALRARPRRRPVVVSAVAQRATGSPRASAACPSSSRRACSTPRSPPGCTCRSTRSRTTSRRSSRSSAYPTADSSSPSYSSIPNDSPRLDGQHMLEDLVGIPSALHFVELLVVTR
jgi:hypothetical protein